jgi:coenzyme F420-0:L-glutamate ligase/coenzyme F420-1:gamma-L-glutamate ligase
MSPSQLILTTLADIPLIQAGDDLVTIILRGLSAAEIVLQDEDVLVLASKIVSKAEGREVHLDTVQASDRAQDLARVTGKDERELELMLRESVQVVRTRPGLIITRHKLGFVSANAGLDHSNVAGGGDCVLLLPEDPDASAWKIRNGLKAATGKNAGVIIADSHGRPHRMGTVGVAIGVAGLPALEDWRGRQDLFGYVLQHTEIGLADMVASAATLLLGQAREGTPVVHVRGVMHSGGEGAARDLIRPQEFDLFP